jgi:flagellar biogenesis protein FliO
MPRFAPSRGITVLGLLLLIIAVIVVAVLLIRYMGGRQTAASVVPVEVTTSSAV